jgi:hypothetical protein
MSQGFLADIEREIDALERVEFQQTNDSSVWNEIDSIAERFLDLIKATVK